MVKYRGGNFNSVSSKQLKKQGIKNNYPKLGTKFWGSSSNNNYGFGNSNIHKNIENRNNSVISNITMNTRQNTGPIPNSPYIFSDEMRNRLEFLESRGDYHAHNTSGGGIGALGKYQIRRDGLINILIRIINGWEKMLFILKMIFLIIQINKNKS